MEVIKTRFGDIEVLEENIIVFPQGLPGFSEVRKFVTIPQGEGSPIFFLQCLDDTDLAFVVADPYAFFQEYKVEATQEDLSYLELDKLDKGVVLVILVASSDPKKITANLQAPVVINPANNKARQIIMTGDKYTTAHRLLA